jgi:alpha-glucosidase
VIYQIYPRSFQDSSGDGVGDLAGIVRRLPYVASLGVDAIWLSPFYPSPQKDFGYDITDMRGVDPRFGTLEDFIALLEAAHAKGLRVLLDFVAPHTSDEHPWFVESRASRDNPRADWYVWADAAPDGCPPNNWLSSFGGSAWRWEPRRAQYVYHPFLSCQPALNLRNSDVVEAIGHEMRFWLDLGVDGFRLDAVQTFCCDPDLRSNPPVGSNHGDIRIGGGPNNPFARQRHLFDRDVPEALEVIEALREVVDAYDPPRVLIGELADMDSARLSEKYTARGRLLHGVYDFDFVNADPDPEALIGLLRRRGAYLPTGWIYNVFTNHDSVRAVSNLTAFATERGLRAEAAKLLIFLQFTLKGGGVIYQGEELGLPHPQLDFDQVRDPWGRALWPDFEGRDGARTPMPWAADAPNAGFTTGREPWLGAPESHAALAVDRQEADPDSVLRFARDFLRWRRGQDLLKWGGERIHDAHDAPLLIFDRFDETRRLVVILNFSLAARFLPIEPEIALLEAPGAVAARSERGVALPPLGFAIGAARR